ncbi:FtsK/SpoIIIE domain-containing protein [Frankia sp. AgB32]|uniref:FtsK/SpoIIIE domain-containing protein n=1 Tax=Frankia sp. AgB32 TaxID=631119 RepID=UPI00200E195D|nr:FtsK/SpoIIIE domain-containing protein [Frankia sp. AgB32]MCK9898375.1 ATP-binding protein [Frankia sp. AgB32]
MSEQPTHVDPSDPDGPDATVLPGPWLPTTDSRAEPGVLEGEVIDQAGRPVAVPPATPPARRAPVVPAGGRELARTAGRVMVQSAQGHAVLVRRAKDAATHAAIREQIRAARARGDQAELAAWLDRLHTAKESRRTRVANLPAVLAAAGMSVLATVLVVAATLVALGILAGVVHPLGVGWSAYWHFLGWLLRTLVTVITVLVPIAGFGAVIGWITATRRAGQDGAALPARLMPVGQRAQVGEEITPSIVVTALRDLGYAELRKSIRDMPDYGAGMLGPIVLAGCGVEVDVALPSGTSTEEIQKRHRKLAENLGRHEHEVFITIPGELRRTVRLWIADPGALDLPIGPSPLVLDPDMTADYYTGRAPWGQDLRGDAVLLRLFQCHLLITGLSNQGKTAALRALLLWLASDPIVEFWIADLKGIGDWSMFEGLATTLIEGPTDSHVMAATAMLEAAVAEMERRIIAVQASGSRNGITRDMAHSGQGLHPLEVVVDEAQVAFMCPAKDDQNRPYGGTAANSRYFQAARRLHNQGRAVNVILRQGTQDPTDQNLPKLVREGAHIRASLVLGTESQARMALGEKAVDRGAAPHKLRYGLDKGTLVVTGEGVPMPPGESSITVRTHFVDGDDAAVIADRAKLRRAQHHTRTAEGPPPDHLADIAAALRGEDPVRTQVVLARLAEANPTTYEKWTFQTLSTTLADHGIKVGKSVGQSVVRAADIHRVITERDDQAGGSGGGSA